MASFGKVLDLLDDRYLHLQDVTGNVAPLPTLASYEEYAQNILVYRMDTTHEIFMGLIQDFTMRRAYQTGKELWTWLVQWEIDNKIPAHQPSSPKKPRLDEQRAGTPTNAPLTPRQNPALTVFERRTLDGALMLEEEMLRILIDIVQVASSLVPNFVEFLYRWVDYYEGDGKALKAALRWEIPSLWDFEYHPLVLPQEEGVNNSDKESSSNAAGHNDTSETDQTTAELRQNSPTKKMQARTKPDLAAIELRTFYSEESERLRYREVKFGIQPPRLEQPLPPLINIPRDYRKRTKYYAACFRSRQRALFLLMEAGMTMRQINNYQKLQTVHPKETSETGDGNGLRNYQKDAKFAQAHFELKEKQIKQREIAISTKLADEAEFAASHAFSDGATGLPLIPPTPSYSRTTNMAATMMRMIQKPRRTDIGRIHDVPGPLMGRLNSKVFKSTRHDAKLLSPRAFIGDVGQYTQKALEMHHQTDVSDKVEESNNAESEFSSDVGSEADDEDAVMVPAVVPRAAGINSSRLHPIRPPRTVISQAPSLGTDDLRQSVPPNIAEYMQNLDTEQARRLLPFLTPQSRQAAASTLQRHLRSQDPMSSSSTPPYVRSIRRSTSGYDGHVIYRNDAATLRNTQHNHHPSSPSAPISRGFGTTGDVSANQTAVTDPPMPLAESLPGFQIQSPLSHQLHATETFHTSTGVPSTNLEGNNNGNLPKLPSSNRFDAEYFLYLRRQQGASSAAISSDTLSQPFVASLSTAPSDLQFHPVGNPSHFQRKPAHHQDSLSTDLTAIKARSPIVQIEASQLNVQSPSSLQLEQPQGLAMGQWRSGDRLSNSHMSFSQPRAMLSLPTMRQHLHPPTTVSEPYYNLERPTQAPVHSHTIPPPGQASSSVMLAIPRPRIGRNAPSPLSLPPPNGSSSATLGPQVLATSPFLDQPSIGLPIQIYLPRVLVPGDGRGSGGIKMGVVGTIETDALMLGHEDLRTGDLVLSKAILLPVGVWENTLKKVRSGRWRVLETYACPSSKPGKGQGKPKRPAPATKNGCHRAAYDKLVQMYGMINDSSTRREDELTKRWRVSRGPMMSCDRGAVWEGWGTYVDRGVVMTAAERSDALRNKDTRPAKRKYTGVGEGGSHAGTAEAKRRWLEMEALMDEDEDMEDELEW